MKFDLLKTDYYTSKAGSPLGGKLSRRKSFLQSDLLIELSLRKNVEPQIVVGIRSTFRGSTFFRPVEIRLKGQVPLPSSSLVLQVTKVQKFQVEFTLIVTNRLRFISTRFSSCDHYLGKFSTVLLLAWMVEVFMARNILKNSKDILSRA